MNELTMMNGISMINGISVGIFGMILSASFCDILWTRKKRLLMGLGMVALLLLQGIVYFFVDFGTVRYLYPIITHLPLAIILCLFSKKRIWAVIAVFTAYLCCQLRRWLALLIVAIAGGGALLQQVTELAMTLPLLLLLIRFVAPAVRHVSYYTIAMQCQFGVVPVLSYGFDYLTQIYTNLFLIGTPVVEEFMAFVCSAAYLVFVLRVSKEERMRNQLEQTQDFLNHQITQAVREIEMLRESQTQASTYRHDLRHHMQYVAVCIENGRLEQAREYIHGIDSEIESGKVVGFCENETANLIFSAFAGRAQEHGIAFEIKAQIPRTISLSESDLCVLLSNALENALHACQKRREKGLSGIIEVLAYEKNGKLFFQFSNSCDNDITFENGVPITANPGHGFGARSICALVERHGGIYTFVVQNEQFILRISI